MLDEMYSRASIYMSDICDAANLKCLMSIIIVYFTCLFPAITFGSILHKNTNGWIGVKETLLATSGCGILFSLFSAQPLLLVGVTGPMIIFEESLHNFLPHAVPPLVARVWVAAWAFMFCVLAVAFDASHYIRYVTKFADDILSTLISVIFFYETAKFLNEVFVLHPVLTLNGYHLNSTERAGSSSFHQPNTALLTVVLVLGTFTISYTLRQLRYSTYFGRTVRRTVAQLSLAIAIFTMVAFDKFVISDTDLTVKLTISHNMRPTHPLRDTWLIDPSEAPLWFVFASIPAGLLLAMVLFVETEVAELMFARREFCLQKGYGYHWDLFVSAVLLVPCALMGVPWVSAAPVRSLAHVNSLTAYRLRAPGQPPVVEHVMEQRITALVIHVAILLMTLFGLNVLSNVPVAVMFGVFLHLGVTNLSGVAMLQRVILILVPVKYHPYARIYCRKVRPLRMHLYTCLQVICFVTVAVVKWIPSISIAYPIAILAALALRHLLLPNMFSEEELNALDGDGEDTDDSDDDDYNESAKRR